MYVSPSANVRVSDSVIFGTKKPNYTLKPVLCGCGLCECLKGDNEPCLYRVRLVFAVMLAELSVEIVVWTLSKLERNEIKSLYKTIFWT